MAATFVYMTAADKEEAVTIGRALLEEKLVACANVLENMTSVYRWQGRIEQDSEAVLIAKSTEALTERLIARVQALHSYDCPCIVCWPIASGNGEYLAWIDAETE